MASPKQSLKTEPVTPVTVPGCDHPAAFPMYVSEFMETVWFIYSCPDCEEMFSVNGTILTGT